MTGPQTLSRPLAARVAAVPAPPEIGLSPELPPTVVQAAVDALDAGKTKYTDRPGILPLRTWVATTLNDGCGLALTPDDVTITCGGTEARFVAIKVLVPPGAQILCPGDPSPVIGPAALAGATVVSQPDAPTTIRAAYLTPDLPRASLDSALEQARDHGWWIIWDMGARRDPAFHPAQDPELAPRVVTLGSLLDSMPGWRVGWLAGSEQSRALRAYKQSMTICSPSISQWAALGLVEPS